MLLLRKIGLGLVLIVLAGCMLSYEQLTIQETITQERIDVRFMAKDFTGDSMIVTMRGKVNKPTNVTIPHGILLSNRNKRQDLVAIRYKGRTKSVDAEKYRAVEETFLNAEKKQTVHFVLEVYSTNFYRDYIQANDQFMINGMAEGDLKKFVDFLADQKDGNDTAKQLAIWAITDDATQDEAIEYYTNIRPEHFKLAEELIIESGLDTADYLMFYEE
ncbi:MAG: hypothetical protein LCH85_20870 [Chloroflexi bacterium]|nr:hypothetical protein [Chloroflexota bacterium]